MADLTVTDLVGEKLHIAGREFSSRLILGTGGAANLAVLVARKGFRVGVIDTDKVEVIAARVGYKNPFVFSTTFKRVMGCPPSGYAAKRR